jgi:hypothetical protein
MSKHIPIRRTRIAEEYAKKVRIEPPKETRQEDPRTKRMKPTLVNAKGQEDTNRQRHKDTKSA